MTDGILEGIRVIEWGDFVSGPWTGRLLGDMGADVLKIEVPGLGDLARRAGPFPQDNPHAEKSGLYLYLNLNKRGITLDLSKEEGRRIFGELVGTADILVENHPPQVVEVLGLSYKALQAQNPRLIMVSISPFGQNGPYRDYYGSELVLFHMGGIGYETPRGEVTDPENEPPLKGPGYQAYFTAGYMAATSAVVGLFQREITGEGQHIDISEQEAIASTQRPNITRYSYSGEVVPRDDTTMGMLRIKPCKDGYFVGFGALGTDLMWTRLCEVMDNPKWTQQEIYSTQASRREHGAELDALIMSWMMDYSKAELFEMGQRAGISSFPLNTVADLFTTEQYQSREFFQEVEHPVAGTYPYPGIPYKLSDRQPSIRRRAPLLGEHNAEVYGQELRRTPAELVRLYQSGVL